MVTPDDKRDRVLKAALECRTELIAYARSLLGDYAAADDAVQEAMIVVVRKHAQFEEGTSILAWCRSIVRIEVLRTKQRSQRETTLIQRVLDDAIDAAFDEYQTSRRHEESESRRDALGRCLEQLPDRGKGILNARFADELSYQQISEKLEITIEAVRKTLFRVRKQIRSCVETRLRAAE